MPRRIVFDIRTLVDSKGQSDGIVRTVRALAAFAAEHRPDVTFAIFDTDVGAFRPLRPKWSGAVLGGAKVDTTHFPDPFGKRPRLREKLPLRLKRIALAIQRPRRRAFLAITRARLSRAQPSRLLDGIHARLMSQKYRDELADPKGGLRLLLPFEEAMDRPLALTDNDIIVLAGSDWSAMHRIASFVAERGHQLAVLCHDIIPLQFPQYFRDVDANRFRVCFHRVFPASALIILTTRRVEADVRRYCKDKKLPLRRTAVVGLGADFTRVEARADATLPAGLQAGRFALFVSTIEPRKNHRLLLAVWKRLIADGVPQPSGFKLVFVGRPGWLMQEFMSELQADPTFGQSLLLLSNVDDPTLSALYAGSAFCLYPSFYEGFGLPVIEAFRSGKAVIASTGGALPEVVQDFSPCLDPNDEDGWYAEMKSWIENPAMRAKYEASIRNGFRMRDWTTAARHFFETIDSECVRSG
jgi:glycosyltransferase involved in cell wall biosynthesis